MEEKPAVERDVRLCSVCGVKPTISDSSTYCASCMARRGNEKRRQGALLAPEKNQSKKTKEGQGQPEKATNTPNMEVVIDFGEYPAILQQLQDLAEQEIRPLDLQMIYILKCHLDASKRAEVR